MMKQRLGWRNKQRHYKLKYLSTRNADLKFSFQEAVLSGLAPDGGLFLPEAYPTISPATIRAWQGKTYQQVAFEIFKLFIEDELKDTVIQALIDQAYQNFSHPLKAPLKELEHNLYLLELFYGPTYSFKDYAMQFLAPLLNKICQIRGEKITIIGATSGDTGSAALHAFQGQSELKIAILHPHNRVSPVQRRQMTCLEGENILNIALEGYFDDCQNHVKALFNDAEFRQNMNPSAVNSINWARIMAQTVYYAFASLQLGAPDQPIAITVPTGNFGNIFAAYIVKKMGFPIETLLIASNQNDILTRCFVENDLSQKQVKPSISPSMDIQISSNFERYLFDLFDRDSTVIASMMQDFNKNGSISLPTEKWQQACQMFQADHCSEQETLQTINKAKHDYKEIIDPHTAVGVFASWNKRNKDLPHIIAATAHPAKFPDAIEQATGTKPDMPQPLADLFDKQERFDIVGNDFILVKQKIISHFQS